MTLRVRAVSEKEREALRRMARSRTVGAGLVRRAQIVLHALEGLILLCQKHTLFKGHEQSDHGQ